MAPGVSESQIVILSNERLSPCQTVAGLKVPKEAVQATE